MKTRSSAWLGLTLLMAALRVSAQNASTPTATPALAQTNSPPAMRAESAPAIKTKSDPLKELSGWAADVAQLSEANMNEDVVYSFIDNSGMFNLDAAQIIALREHGVPSPFIVAMIQHDADAISGARPLTISSSPSKPATIQVVLTPAAKEKQPVNPPANNPLSKPVEEDWLDSIADWPDTVSATPAIMKGNSSLYRVRQPYPEQVTPPILVFKAAGVVPNTLVIQFSQ